MPDVETLGRAYVLSADASGTREGRGMAVALARELHARHARTRLDIVPVQHDPYPAPGAWVADVRRGVMMVSSVGNDSPVLDGATNLLFRACHDVDHLACGGDFSEGGEYAAFRVAAARWPQLAHVLWSEIVLQRCALSITGAFQPQKLVLTQGPFEVTRA